MDSGNPPLLFALPSRLREVAQRGIALCEASETHPPIGVFSARVEGEVVSIPDRLYFERTEIPDALKSHTERFIAAAILTRHHNGFVREKNVRALIQVTEEWVAPFVIKLLGEYVIEIVEFINFRVNELDPSAYVPFVQANPEFMEVTRQRATSYWDRYFRWHSPIHSYPGLLALNHLRELTR